MTMRPSSTFATAALPSFWRLQLAGWGGLLVVLVGARTDHRPYVAMVGWRIVYIALGLLLSLALRDVLRRAIARAWPTLGVAAACVGASYLLALVWAASYNVVRQPTARLFAHGLLSVDALTALFLGTINDAIILAAWGFLYLGLQRSVALQREHARVHEAETLLAESRLRELRYQLNPHLLFNALNAISTLIAEGQSGDATRMIARLSDLLRTTLRADGPAIVPLAEELTVVGQYLDVELIRFGGRLDIGYDVEEQAYLAQVPALLLQPLVENAIRHGVSTLESGGTVLLRARADRDTLRVEVIDNGPGFPPGFSLASDNGHGHGHGLSNVVARLRGYYGDAASVSWDSGAAGTCVRLVIPVFQARVSRKDA